MKTKFAILGFLLLKMAAGIDAQTSTIYEPLEIRKAYDKGTRDRKGVPGRHYWQNKADYNIRVELNPPSNWLYGRAEVIYYNHSPDTLKQCIVKLLHNHRRAEAARNMPVDPAYITEGIHLDSVYINGKVFPYTQMSWNIAERIKIPEPLAPGKNLRFEFVWRLQLSPVIGREGMVDSTSFFLAYFFPRLAVYDDYHGWDNYIFTGQQEFYNDNGNFSLQVKVPQHYAVWATGELQNPESVLQEPYLSRYNMAKQTLQKVNIFDPISDTLTPLNTAKFNIWKFEAGNVPDVAFGISDHYEWDGGSTYLAPDQGKKVFIQAAYLPTAADFRNMISWSQFALQWFSQHLPGVNYPYPCLNVFQGNADMEYPMYINDSSFDDTTFSRMVLEHELAHTWFPFYTGINESRYPMMDEGMAVFFELMIGRARMGENANVLIKQFRFNSYRNNHNADTEIPTISPADALKGIGYQHNAYNKSAFAYYALQELLGDKLFKKCLLEFMDRWHGKHPTPWDFFYTFNEVSGMNLNWFWNNWFMEFAYIDLNISVAKYKNKTLYLEINNTGKFMVPFHVVIQYPDGSQDKKYYSPAVWRDINGGLPLKLKCSKKPLKAYLDTGIYMDKIERDNHYHIE